MKSFIQYIEESTEMRLKDLLPKKWKHALNRVMHKDKYKGAIKAIHRMKKKYPDYSDTKVLGIIADFSHIPKKELKQVLDRKTRYN